MDLKKCLNSANRTCDNDRKNNKNENKFAVETQSTSDANEPVH
jgi:hypothetical protein